MPCGSVSARGNRLEVWKRATEAQGALARALAAIIIKTADEMTEVQAKRADDLMRENPDWGYLDAAAKVMEGE